MSDDTETEAIDEIDEIDEIEGLPEPEPDPAPDEGAGTPPSKD